MQKDNQAADDDHDGFGADLFGEQGAERCGDNAADEQPQYGFPAGKAFGHDEYKRFSQGDKEFREIYRSDGFVGGVPGGNESGCNNGPPAATTDGVTGAPG